ncbi:hypothetical protein GGR57DRAFT_511484 [Xylariaceae sp. FL1272]|nr:hypothetical protein GGR57DRAFT_511484 [Xylariaceae sp. FL1272]
MSRIKPNSFLRRSLSHLTDDLCHRLRYGHSLVPVDKARALSCLLALRLPRSASTANTYVFTPVQTLDLPQQTSVNQEGGEFDFNNWLNRGMTIRGGDTVYSCLANLTAALELVGQLNQAEYNGAAGAMSLLPTAGALLGAPTREMWIVYKLIPVAGILSMFLSLGGSITPSNVGDYDPDKPFSFGGFMPTNAVKAPRRPKSRATSRDDREDGEDEGLSAEEDLTQAADIRRFAQEVKQRAEDDGGGSIFLRIWVAIGLQLGLIIALLIPMYYAQRGAVITWWCRVWGWMWVWYLLVTIVAIFDNLVAAPFTESYTIRVSSSPTGVILDQSSTKIHENPQYSNALEYIKAGPVMNQRVILSNNTGASFPRTCFYVIISIKGIGAVHAIAQVVAKLSSVAVFAFGTALFASATLMSISIALMVLSVILAAGVGGRVLAMWIVAAMNRYNKPIIHKMVRSEEDAARYFQALTKLDVQMEIRGHVLVNGTVVTSRHQWFTPATYLRLLAKPFDIVSLADKRVSSVLVSETSPISFASPIPIYQPVATWPPSADAHSHYYTQTQAECTESPPASNNGWAVTRVWQ